jgi:hypothetical protein
MFVEVVSYLVGMPVQFTGEYWTESSLCGIPSIIICVVVYKIRSFH